jgi:hypothetical protein
MPGRPVPYWGWGDLPDQYGRRCDDDGGEVLGIRAAEPSNREGREE